MARWYYAVNGQQRGPIEFAAMQTLVQSGQIQPDTMVWEEGMPQWIAAKESATLYPAAVSASAQNAATDSPLTRDAGPFWKFGNQFSRSGAGAHTGVIVASPHAFYLLKLGRNNAAAGAAGGLIGVMLASAFQNEDDARTCSVAELPPVIREQLDPKNKHAERDAIVLPRTAVSMVSVSWMRGYKVTCGPDAFTITPRSFKGKATKQFLTDNGWRINEPMQPTTGPIHGSNFNRPAGAPPKKRMGIAARVGLVILAVVILILVVMARVALEK